MTRRPRRNQSPAFNAKVALGAIQGEQTLGYARDKVELARRLMAQWVGKLGFELDILADYILNEIKKAE